MTSTNIPGIHGRSNQHYSTLLESLELSPCHGGELRGLGQLPIHPIAHQYGIGARQLHAFEAALRVPRSVLQDEAIGLQIAILLQQAEPVFLPWTYGAYGKCLPKGCWHTIDVTLGVLFPPFALRQRRDSCSQGLGRSGMPRDRDIARP
jgi:hypothetical protein